MFFISNNICPHCNKEFAQICFLSTGRCSECNKPIDAKDLAAQKKNVKKKPNTYRTTSSFEVKKKDIEKPDVSQKKKYTTENTLKTDTKKEEKRQSQNIIPEKTKEVQQAKENKKEKIINNQDSPTTEKTEEKKDEQIIESVSEGVNEVKKYIEENEEIIEDVAEEPEETTTSFSDEYDIEEYDDDDAFEEEYEIDLSRHEEDVQEVEEPEETMFRDMKPPTSNLKNNIKAHEEPLVAPKVKAHDEPLSELEEEETVEDENKAKKKMSCSEWLEYRRKQNQEKKLERFETEDKFDFNTDGFYDDTKAIGEAKPDVISKTLVLKAVGFVVALFLVIAFLVFYA